MTGAEVKRLRQSLEENQTQFAARFGVNQSTVSDWEAYGVPASGTARAAIKSLKTILNLSRRRRATRPARVGAE